MTSSIASSSFIGFLTASLRRNVRESSMVLSALADNPILRIEDIRCTKAFPTVRHLEAQAAVLARDEYGDPGLNSQAEAGRHACYRRIAGQMRYGTILRRESNPIAARGRLDRFAEVSGGPDVAPPSACHRDAQHD